MRRMGILLMSVLFGGCSLIGSQTSTATIPAPTNQLPVLPSVTSTVLPGALVLDPVTRNLSAQSQSGQAGTVLFEDYGDRTRVTIRITAGISSESQPAHIHWGLCENPGEVVYPLNNVVGGVSDTIVGAQMSSLFLDPMIVNVHKSAEEANIYTACTAIKQ